MLSPSLDLDQYLTKTIRYYVDKYKNTDSNLYKLFYEEYNMGCCGGCGGEDHQKKQEQETSEEKSESSEES